ncbi:MAG TPA: redox-regulated ATPase YchF [Bacteroidetes bacterium]|nr:redox-regulated ATPase YchF [Candidatus Limimorpha avicola]
MALNCGIIGLTNTGKTTIFNCISNTKAEVGFAAKSNVGMCEVVDERLKLIDNISHSRRIVPATVEIVDLPGLSRGGQGVGNKLLAEVQTVDALIHVLRCFDDDNIPHSEGSIDPVRDMELVDLELQVRDLDLVTRKLQRIEKLLKNGEKDNKRAFEVLSVYKETLENMQNARNAPVTDEDKIYIQDIQLLTAKPIMYVCNVDDASALTGNKYSDAVKAALNDEDMLIIAGKLESEIAELDDDDRVMFMEDAGLTEPGVNKLVRLAYKTLKLQSFFTTGPDETRAWTIHRGDTAPVAAGVIHSDLQRGFIRAEVMSVNDFLQFGSEQAVKEAGKFRVEGKNYVVRDGDILNIRFNV